MIPLFALSLIQKLNDCYKMVSEKIFKVIVVLFLSFILYCLGWIGNLRCRKKVKKTNIIRKLNKVKQARKRENFDITTLYLKISSLFEHILSSHPSFLCIGWLSLLVVVYVFFVIILVHYLYAGIAFYHVQ